MSLDDTRAETTHDCFIFISSFLLYGLRPLQTQGVARSMPLVIDPSSLLSQPVFALLCFTPISSALQHIVISPGRRARLLFLSPSLVSAFSLPLHILFPLAILLYLGGYLANYLRSLDSLLNLPYAKNDIYFIIRKFPPAGFNTTHAPSIALSD
jgi:hypothetical protein